MSEETNNHGYNVPEAGTQNWHAPLNENFEALEVDVEIRASGAPDSGEYAPEAGAKYLDTDTGEVYLGDGTDWNPLGEIGGATEGRYLDDGGFSGPAEWYNDGDTDTNNVYSTAGVVAGGRENTVSAHYAMVGGGRDNSAHQTASAVLGGENNTASGELASVGGGEHNEAGANYAVVAGGGSDEPETANAAVTDHSAIGGGEANTAGDTDEEIHTHATVGGGENNTASGGRSTVGGGGENVASTWYATVGGGDDNEASGDRSVVGGGLNNVASDRRTVVAGGESNTATDRYGTTGGGRNNTASGRYATVAGGGAADETDGNLAVTDHSTVGGGETNVAGDDEDDGTTHATVAGGDTNTASGHAATVPGGASNDAVGDFSIAVGRNATAATDGAFVVGDSSTDGIESTGEDEALFQMPFYATDELGFRDNPIHVNSAADGWYFNDGVVNNFRVIEGEAVSMFYGFDAIGDSLCRSDLEVQGDFTESSDRRIKSDITHLEGVLEDVCSLEPAQFRRTTDDDSGTGPLSVGFIAQEVREVFPELVRGDESDGLLSLGYSHFTGLAVQAIKEQQALIDGLESETASLREENDELRERLSALESRLGTLEARSQPSPADD